MGLFDKKPKGPEPGTPYYGPACYCDDYAAVPRPGYYALSEDGREILADRPLVCVDDAPGNPDNPACHYEHAGPTDNPQRRADGTETPVGRVVQFEAHDAIGSSTTEMN